jgi:hypothetical protein
MKPTHTPIRALGTFDRLEPGHRTFLVDDNRSVPHLRPNEYAVIDTSDRELQHGELYLVQFGTGRGIFQARSTMLRLGGWTEPGIVWWVRALRGMPTPDQMEVIRETAARRGMIPVFDGLSDGPYETDHLQSKLIGRVVGVAFSALDALIRDEPPDESELRRADEAFDPVEYVDLLLSDGRAPFVVPGRIGGYHLCEPPGTPPCLDESGKAAFTRARERYLAAPSSAQRVVHECLRRGFVRTFRETRR